ncbi:hypothetical protein [Oscillochloris sp. ZM17-4]|uniref:hypothetical protein n=1 Tax=Oscillochloris sp. ZM17-4 TaxID=2866714 RepID=UPI0021034863|nr:hypothetical protein [Oscillochloris sp. ZM17-4]
MEADHAAPRVGHRLDLGEQAILAHPRHRRVLGEGQGDGGGGTRRSERGADLGEGGVDIEHHAGRVGEAARDRLGVADHADLGRDGCALGEDGDLRAQSLLVDAAGGRHIGRATGPQVGRCRVEQRIHRRGHADHLWV